MFVVGSKGLCGPLYHKDQMPEHFHESFIIKGYRSPKSSLSQCMLSLFAATNETLNFWTHFLPSCYFMWTLRDMALNLDFRHDSYTWPFLAYMVMMCIYPLASSVAHLFNTMSDNARHICFFIDYSVISASAYSTSLSYKAYSFPSALRSTFIGDLFLNAAFICSIICVVLSCRTRQMRHTAFRKLLRTGSLGLPCVFSLLPVLYRLCSGTDREMSLNSSFYHLLTIIFFVISAFLYGSHLPERLFPGSFDIVGHSHQLFHVCAIISNMNQMQGILYDLKERKSELIANWEFEMAGSSIGSLALVLLVNSVIIVGYTYLLYKNKLKSA